MMMIGLFLEMSWAVVSAFSCRGRGTKKSSRHMQEEMRGASDRDHREQIRMTRFTHGWSPTSSVMKTMDLPLLCASS